MFQLLGIVLKCPCIPAHRIEHTTSKAEDIGQGKRVVQFSSQSQDLLAATLGLIRITKTPQAASRKARGAEPCIHTTQEHERLVMLLRFIEGNHLLEVGLSRGVFSEVE